MIKKLLPDPYGIVVGILSEIKEGMEGKTFTIIPTKSALNITWTFAPEHKRKGGELDDTDKRLMQKVGIAIYSSYLSSFAKFFQKKITFDPPNVISTYGRTLQDYMLLHFEGFSEFMVIKVRFDIKNSDIKGEFILLFTTDSVSSLLYNRTASNSTIY
ncbi:hypothetical protein GOV05_01145 [Candidatus Woesearchaeota archaeon]|nr:hypothetical protein [Candidatus Woesearchaeota archaeon]